MRARKHLGTLALLLIASPAFAQFGIPSVVYDPSNYAKNALTAVQTKAMVDQLLLLSERLPGSASLSRARTADAADFLPRTLDHLIRIYAEEALHPLIASHAGTIDAIDQIIFTAQHQVGAARGLDEAISPALDFLTQDVTSGDPTRAMTAALDAMNASELVARRQGQAGQALLSSLLEIETARAQQARDSDWTALLMRAGFLTPRDYGADTSWSLWRQP